MTLVILDTNVFQQDWLCTGLRFELLRHRPFYPPLSVSVPAVVVEELVAHHGREVDAAAASGAAAERKLARLGVGVEPAAMRRFDYRQHLLERFDEIFGITVLGWPDIDHQALVARAAARTAPFDQKGGGYRDALIWTDVIAVAASGQDVVLVSHDKAFGANGVLHPSLAAEAAPLRGGVALVDDFTGWLLSRLPWTAADLSDAVDKSRDEQFAEWFLGSDFQATLLPDAGDLRLPSVLYAFEVQSVEWNGELARAGQREAADGVAVVEYDIGQSVEFTAEIAAGAPLDPSWDMQPAPFAGRTAVHGIVDMLVRAAVLYDVDYWGIEDLSWRRSYAPAPTGGSAAPQERLF